MRKSKMTKPGEIAFRKRTPELVLYALLATSVVFSLFVFAYLPSHDAYQAHHPLDGIVKKAKELLQEKSISKQVQSQRDSLAFSVLNKENGKNESPNYFLVFSTSCSPSQDWQSYVFFYHAWKINQPGTITRIASGCTDKQINDLTKLHKDQIAIMSDRFKVHFAPACEDSRSKYFNKPFGLRDYMEKSLGYPDDHHDNDIIMIVDPDMMLLRPLTHRFNLEKTKWVVPGPTSATVTHGHPISQAYGFGSSWITSIAENASYVAGDDSPALQVEKGAEAAHYYPAGPPYLATARDMYQIAVHWTKFVVRIHDIFPHFMSEMHAYSFAAAHLKLPHQLANSFMVSDVDVAREGWDFLRSSSREGVCDPNSIPMEDLPYVFHYCQRYALGRWFIGKYKIPKNLFECDTPLLREPPIDVAVKYDWYIYPNGKDILNYAKKPFRVLQNGWAMCRLISSLNEVLTNYKSKHCDPSVANFTKSHIFHKQDDFNSFLQGEVPELPPP
mmetsp:Transcript_22853/g.34650  ORF Transcript_22853/g.34650 Transcript_22853/m.34650 type:complete len:500 (-) Transcript_22853:47-1546(-)